MECWNDGVMEESQNVYSSTQYSNIPFFLARYLTFACRQAEILKFEIRL
jgi:hypothetical protein